MGKKIFVCKFHEESCSFNPVITTTADFHPKDISKYRSFDELYDLQCVESGAFSVFRGTDYEYGGSVVMTTKSGGPVSDESVAYFLEKTVPAIEKEKPDGIVVALHGATVSESSGDVCGDILSAIRKAAGEASKIAVACDLHANITEKVRKNADFVCGYQYYPHIDHYNTGKRAATVLKAALEGAKLKTVYTHLPIIAPPHAYTTHSGNVKKLYDKVLDLCSSGRVSDCSIFQVQPWLDVPEIASVVTLIGSDEADLIALSKELASEEFALRKELQGEKQASIRDVIEEALKNKTGKPVVLGDAADSPNAGATGDSARVIEELLPYRDRLSAALTVTDPPAVEKAFASGVGATIDLTLGGAIAPKINHRVKVEGALVKSLHLGNYKLGYPYVGSTSSIGRSAVLQVGKLEILVVTNGHGHGDLQYYRGFGIDPTLFDLVQIKACTSFRANYEPLAAKIMTPKTQGVAGTVLTELPFKHLPKPLYPFEEITENMISEPRIYR